MNYSVITSDAALNAASAVGKNEKKSVVLASAWDKPYTIASLVVDGIQPPAEVHEHDIDVFRVIGGKGAFILGGTLVNQKDNGGGEWVGDSIEGGERHEVSVGDIIDIPPGVPHQFDVSGGRMELVIVKIRKVA